MTTEVNTIKDIIFPFDKYDMLPISDHIARDYYCALHLAGHKIQLEWNGGGDSGEVWINLDEKRVDLPWEGHKQNFQERIHQHVIHEMYVQLDYGSWAGEFNSCGTADFVHDGDFIGFRGTDYCGEEEGHTGTINLDIRIPAAWITEEMKMIWVDISDGYDGSPPEVSLYATAKDSGKYVNFPEEFKTDVDALEKAVSERLNDEMSVWNASNVYENEGIDIEDPTKDVVMTLETVNYFTMEETEKYVEIDLFQIED
jgi:hypothetical protein